jgi:hypothetical protein
MKTANRNLIFGGRGERGMYENKYQLNIGRLGHYFMEPGDYEDAPVSKILHFIRSVGLLEG